jgi:uncharacterized protein (TIGR02145 family)
MKTVKTLFTAVFILISLLFLNSCKKENEYDPNKVIDIDGNVYSTIIIGDQVWMAENLKVTRFRNGDPIPNVKDSIEWTECTSSAHCDYNNDAGNSLIYGKLYNGYCLFDSRNLAPKGWHLPSDEEWTKLVDFLGGSRIAGDKLKEINPHHWIDATATNESGFTGLPGGKRNENGSFTEARDCGYWWSTSQKSDTTTYARGLYFYYSGVARGYSKKTVGFSIRCIKDQDL